MIYSKELSWEDVEWGRELKWLCPYCDKEVSGYKCSCGGCLALTVKKGYGSAEGYDPERKVR